MAVCFDYPWQNSLLLAVLSFCSTFFSRHTSESHSFHPFHTTKSRNPISRRTGEQITLSPEAAMAELKTYEDKIRKEGVVAVFPTYAAQRSDCSSFRQSGDLGFFGRGDMQKPFEDAAFALQKDEMSGIVSTDSGYHLIYRIA